MSDDFAAVIPPAGAITLAVVCAIGSAMFSGLTLGLLTLDIVQLKLLINRPNKTPEDERNAKYARKILPLRSDGNYLLVTLLTGNVAVNAGFSILLGDLTDGLVGFLISTVVITIFGEILPQAACARHGLVVGGVLAPLVYALEWLLFPVVKPIAMILNCVLGEDLGTIYDKKQLSALVDYHDNVVHVLTRDEARILKGGLEFAFTRAEEVMTPMDEVYGIDVDSKLNYDVLSEVLSSGYSRIPVFDRSGPQCIVGLLFVKDLILVDCHAEVEVRKLLQFFGRGLYAVDDDTPLLELLKTFKQGHTHLAVVRRVSDDGDGDPFYIHAGIITLEDVMEEILQDEINDEFEHDKTQSHRRRKHQKLASSSAQASVTYFTQARSLAPRFSVSSTVWEAPGEEQSDDAKETKRTRRERKKERPNGDKKRFRLWNRGRRSSTGSSNAPLTTACEKDVGEASNGEAEREQRRDPEDLGGESRASSSFAASGSYGLEPQTCPDPAQALLSAASLLGLSSLEASPDSAGDPAGGSPAARTRRQKLEGDAGLDRGLLDSTPRGSVRGEDSRGSGPYQQASGPDASPAKGGATLEMVRVSPAHAVHTSRDDSPKAEDSRREDGLGHPALFPWWGWSADATGHASKLRMRGKLRMFFDSHRRSRLAEPLTESEARVIASFLSSSIPAFSPQIINERLLISLLSCFFCIQPPPASLLWRSALHPELLKHKQSAKREHPQASTFEPFAVVVLYGRVRLYVGNEGIPCTAGPLSCLAVKVLGNPAPVLLGQVGSHKTAHTTPQPPSSSSSSSSRGPPQFRENPVHMLESPSLCVSSSASLPSSPSSRSDARGGFVSPFLASEGHPSPDHVAAPLSRPPLTGTSQLLSRRSSAPRPCPRPALPPPSSHPSPAVGIPASPRHPPSLPVSSVPSTQRRLSSPVLWGAETCQHSPVSPSCRHAPASASCRAKKAPTSPTRLPPRRRGAACTRDGPVRQTGDVSRECWKDFSAPEEHESEESGGEKHEEIGNEATDEAYRHKRIETNADSRRESRSKARTFYRETVRVCCGSGPASEKNTPESSRECDCVSSFGSVHRVRSRSSDGSRNRSRGELMSLLSPKDSEDTWRDPRRTSRETQAGYVPLSSRCDSNGGSVEGDTGGGDSQEMRSASSRRDVQHRSHRPSPLTQLDVSLSFEETTGGLRFFPRWTRRCQSAGDLYRTSPMTQVSPCPSTAGEERLDGEGRQPNQPDVGAQAASACGLRREKEARHEDGEEEREVSPRVCRRLSPGVPTSPTPSASRDQFLRSHVSSRESVASVSSPSLRSCSGGSSHFGEATPCCPGGSERADAGAVDLDLDADEAATGLVASRAPNGAWRDRETAEIRGASRGESSWHRLHSLESGEEDVELPRQPSTGGSPVMLEEVCVCGVSLPWSSPSSRGPGTEWRGARDEGLCLGLSRAQNQADSGSGSPTEQRDEGEGESPESQRDRRGLASEKALPFPGFGSQKLSSKGFFRRDTTGTSASEMSHLLRFERPHADWAARDSGAASRRGRDGERPEEPAGRVWSTHRHDHPATEAQQTLEEQLQIQETRLRQVSQELQEKTGLWRDVCERQHKGREGRTKGETDPPERDTERRAEAKPGTGRRDGQRRAAGDAEHVKGAKEKGQEGGENVSQVARSREALRREIDAWVHSLQDPDVERQERHGNEGTRSDTSNARSAEVYTPDYTAVTEGACGLLVFPRWFYIAAVKASLELERQLSS
uniref:Metal transporter CNNM2, related n=1 Tax=Neospora caninum (strain Liverpool) TaxID=572307 RepID=A0A0F7UA86_NEOCL|nr:TPA: Metal transporter CNNM2, related [Neospora caninum Liverpool]